MAFSDSAEELKHLKRAMSDLVSVLALPAVWSGQEPRQIVMTFHDALMSTLDLDFLYSRAKFEASVQPIKILRTAPLSAASQNVEKTLHTLNRRFEDAPQNWPAEERGHFGGQEYSLLSLPLGIGGEIGIVVASSARADFPTQSERMLLSVAANQVTVALQQARLLSEQKRIAGELEFRVAERTLSLAAANVKLRKEIDDRKRAEEALRASEINLRQIIDSVPGLVCTMSPAGETELVNRPIMEYFGKSIEELKGWTLGNNDAVHPDDLPRVISDFRHSITTGTPFETELRLRRADGVYRWFKNNGGPVQDTGGRITGWYFLIIDIDDRKCVEEALRASERNLYLTINTIPALAWSARPDGTAEYFNQHYLDYLGLTQDQAQDWGWTEAVHPDDLDGLIDAWQFMTNADKGGECEARLRRFDGIYRWFLFRTNPLRDESGKTIKWYGTNTDIDDRKRADEESRRSEARKTAILDSAIDCIVTINHEGCITEFNPAAERTFGYRRIDVLGKQLSDVMIPPSYREEHRQGLARYQATGESRVLGKRIELTAVRADGTEFPVELAISRIPMDGPPSFTGCLRDITERKQAEQELRRSEAFLAEGQRLSRTGSFFWRVATEEIVWSEQLSRIFELDPSLKMTLELIGSRMHPEDLFMLNDMVEGARYGSDLEREYRILLPDYTVKYLHVVAHGTKSNDGQWEYVGAVQDVTDRRLSDEALNKARSELASVSRTTSLGIMTAAIAHEVNQPLSGIVTNASTCLRMLDSQPPNIEGARETARRTIRDGNRASEIVTRLRALFKRKEVATEPIDLNDAAREVIALSWSELQSERIMVRQEFDEDLPAVRGDRIQIQQVILNLLRNASDAMREIDDRPRQLLIKTECDDGKNVQLTVQDTGVGFAPDAVDRLFESFYTTKQEGTGIGLSVSRSIIEAHRGHLWASANDGPGSSFAFSIPHDYSSEPN